jgi:hypothetical protein
MPSLSHHVKLALYLEHMFILAMYCKPVLLVIYLEAYLSNLEQWLRECMIAINVLNSTANIFARARMRFLNPRTVQLFGEPIQWVDTTCYLGVILDMRLTWSPHIDQTRNKAAQRLGVLGSLLNRSGPFTWNGSCCTSSSSSPRWTMHSPHGGSLPSPTLQQMLQSKCLCFAAGAHR